MKQNEFEATPSDSFFISVGALSAGILELYDFKLIMRQ
jgi:hypothetical protein